MKMKLTVLFIASLYCGLAEAKCKFKKSGDWSACSAEGLRTRTDALKTDKSDATCAKTRNITKVCRQDCQYERRRRADWGECVAGTNTVHAIRRLAHGVSCPSQLTEVFDCRILRRFIRKPAGLGKKAGNNKLGKKAVNPKLGKKVGRNSGDKKNQRKQRRQQQQRRLLRKQRRQEHRQNQQAN